MDVEERRENCWETIVKDRIMIPASSIKLYDSQGKKTGRLVYSNQHVTLETMSVTAATDKPLLADEGRVFLDEFEDEVSESPYAVVAPEDTRESEYNSLQETQSEMSLTLDSTSLNESSTASVPIQSSYIDLNLEKHTEGLKTSLGNCLKKFFGADDDLTLFDELRFNIMKTKKTRKLSSKAPSISRYSQLSAKLSTQVLARQSELAKQLKDIEHDYFQKYGTFPNKTNSTEYSKILKEKNLATAILRNINARNI